MAFDAGAVIAKIKADLTEFQKGLNEAKGAAQRFADQTKDGINNMNESIKSVEPELKKLAIGFGAVGAAGALMMKSWLANATEQLNVEKKLEALILNQKDATMQHVEMLKRQAAELQKVGVVGDEVVISAQAQLATFDLSAEAIAKLTPAFLDLVVAEKGMNATTDDMIGLANGLGKVLQGQTDGLSRQGFKFTEAQEKMLTYGTEMERATALADILGSTYNGLNEQMRQTFDGRMKSAIGRIGDIKEALGKGLIPVMEKVLDVGEVLIGWFENLSPEMGGLIVAGTLLGTALSFIIAGFAGIALALPSITAGLALLGTVVATITGFIAAWAIPVLAVIALAAALYGAWRLALYAMGTNVSEFMQMLKDFWTILMQNLVPIFSGIAQAGAKVPELIAKAWNFYLNGITDTIQLFIQHVINLINMVNKLPGISIDTAGLESARNAVYSFQQSAQVSMEDVGAIFDKIGTGIKGGASRVMDGLRTMGQGFSDFGNSFNFTGNGIGNAANNMAEEAGGASDKLAKQLAKDAQEALENRRKMIAAFGEMKDKIQATLTDLREKHKTTMENLQKDIASVKTRLSELTADYQADLKEISDELAKKIGDMQSTLNKNVLKIKVRFEEEKAEITADTNRATAEKFVEQEQEVADIKEAIAKATTFAEKSRLEKELAEKQKILDTDRQYVVGLEAEIQEVKRVNSLTDIQRLQEEATAKIAEAQRARDADIAAAQAEFAERKALAEREAKEATARREADYLAERAKIQKELGDLQKAMADELFLFDAKEKAIIELRNKAVAVYAQQIREMVAYTDRAVNAMIDRYNALNTAIQQVGKARTLSNLKGSSNVDIGNVGRTPNLPDLENPISNLKVPSIPKLAAGGIVRASPGGILALIGEGKHDEKVVPLDGRNEGGIHIHLHDAIISSKEAAVEMLDYAMRRVQPRLGL